MTVKTNLNVLSLYDGMGCGRIALDRAGFNIGKYYASEIDKHAIKVSSHHYPDVIHLGCVKEIDVSSLDKIDLLIGGSPCQGFSFAGKQLNFEDPRSKLFFEFIKLKEKLNPKYFLLENVKMKKEYQDKISEYIGVEPIEINSSLLSAQNRVRLYWTNIPNIVQPNDKGVKLEDILDVDVEFNSNATRVRGLDLSTLNKATIIGRRLNERGKREDYNKFIPIIQCLEVRASNRSKSNCLTTVAKDNVLTPMPIGRHPNAFKDNLPFRYYSLKEYCRLQTVDDTYFDGIVSENQAKKMLGNGWTVDVIAYILNHISHKG